MLSPPGSFLQGRAGMSRVLRCVLLIFSAALAAVTPLAAQAPAPEVIVIDAQAAAQPFPHYWERMFGSGRAILTLRESYRHDLRAVKQVTDFQYVRFHNIFHDEVGVYDEDAHGNPVYNFSYVDQIYDGLLERGVRPFVELSFMPKKLAAREILHPFWYKPITAPPKDWNKWEDLIYQFTRHLVERYGVDEVSRWYFEVWNEPNIDFWSGEPKQATYFQLYDSAARAIKRVNQRLRIGGPSTAQAAWVGDFIRHCVDNRIPLDFVSSHVYGNDSAQNVFGSDENIPRDRMVCRAIKKVHDEVKASARPDLPIHWTEYNASYMNETEVTDSPYMAPWLADTIRQCDGLVDNLAYWTFSDVFEEQGVVKQPFYGGFGLIAAGGVPKPAYNAFKLLHRLGDRRLRLDSTSALATLRSDGAIVVAAWNLVPPAHTGTARRFTVRLKNRSGARPAVLHRVDPTRGNALPAYQQMGKPRYPTPAQYRQLQNAAELPSPEKVEFRNGELTLEVPAHGLALIEIP